MVEINNCLILKYIAYNVRVNNYKNVERCFILNEEYAKKFKQNKITSFNTIILTQNEFDKEEVLINLYFEKEINKYVYDMVKALCLIDCEEELTKLIKNF